MGCALPDYPTKVHRMNLASLAKKYARSRPRAWARHLRIARRACSAPGCDYARERDVLRVVAATSLLRELEARRAAQIAAADAEYLDRVSTDPHWHELRRVERALDRSQIEAMNRALGIASPRDATIVRDREGRELVIHPPR